jgi:tetratricopeptide (TPR) repeat protein
MQLLDRAIEGARSVADPAIEAMVLGNIVQQRLDVGESDPSLRTLAERQLQLYESLADEHGSLHPLYRLGQVLHRLGHPADAVRIHKQNIMALGTDRLPIVKAATLVRVAEGLLDLDCNAEAAEFAKKGIALCRRLRTELLEAGGLLALGDALARIGDHRLARALWEQAQEIYERFGLPIDAAGARSRLVTAEAPAV